MLIFITGYMGAGKTTLGKNLAGKLGYKFIDLDELLIAETGYPIGDFFNLFGEEAFRLKEREILIKHLSCKDTVIATGGGTPCYEDNMELMNASGITVFLDTDLNVLLERLTVEYKQRPLLKDVPVEKLTEFIKEHLGYRRKYYSRARFSLKGYDEDSTIFKYFENLI